MKRLTPRSKFRAAQALKFIAGTKTIMVDAKATSAEDLRSFLFCLAELQETRLPTSEEVLMDALGIARQVAEGGVITSTDPRSLVRTWLHDEGEHSDVMELSRDILLAAKVTEEVIWSELLSHMDRYASPRILLQTLVLIRSLPCFPSLCLRSVEPLIAVSRFGNELASKAEQVLEILKTRCETEALAQTALGSGASTTSSSSSFPSSSASLDGVALPRGHEVDKENADVNASVSMFLGGARTGKVAVSNEDGSSTKSVDGSNAAPTSRRIVLCPRFSLHQADAREVLLHEDLCLGLEQFCSLWNTMSPLLPQDKLASTPESQKMREVCFRLLSIAGAHHNTLCLPSSVQTTSTLPYRLVCKSTLKCGLDLLGPVLTKGGEDSATFIHHSLESVATAVTAPASFKWSVLCSSTKHFDKQTTHKALDMSKNVDVIAQLLQQAASSWDASPEAKEATLRLISWCLLAKENDRAEKVSHALASLQQAQRRSLIFVAGMLKTKLAPNEAENFGLFVR